MVSRKHTSILNRDLNFQRTFLGRVGKDQAFHLYLSGPQEKCTPTSLLRFFFSRRDVSQNVVGCRFTLREGLTARDHQRKWTSRIVRLRGRHQFPWWVVPFQESNSLKLLCLQVSRTDRYFVPLTVKCKKNYVSLSEIKYTY